MVTRAEEEKAYRQFEASLAAFIQEEMPCADNYGDAANDAAWELAKSKGPSLWGAMQSSVDKLAEAGKEP